MMTKRDFQELATALYEARMSVKERRTLAELIAGVCQRNNPAFDRVKFFEAAGVISRTTGLQK